MQNVIDVTVDWLQHACHCEKCRRVDTAKPATFIYTCHEGAKSLKKHLADLAAPKIAAARRAARLINKDQNRATLKQLKAVMRYK